jgi:hypothetical protein
MVGPVGDRHPGQDDDLQFPVILILLGVIAGREWDALDPVNPLFDLGVGVFVRIGDELNAPEQTGDVLISS